MEEKVIEKEIEQKEKTRHFAEGLNFYKLFWVFFIGCFIGVVIETIVCIIVLRRIESRAGVIYGPFNPVYGFGAVLVTIALDKVKDAKNIWIFLYSMVLGAAFEYICSKFQEIAFGTVSWEYSNLPFNIAGRTSLMYGIAWGILGLFWVKLIYPNLSRFIESIPNKAGFVITWILIGFMVFDMGISTCAAIREEERRNNIKASNAFEEFLDKHYDSEFMRRIYPNAIPRDQKFIKGNV